MSSAYSVHTKPQDGAGGPASVGAASQDGAGSQGNVARAAVTLGVLLVLVGALVGWTWWLWGGASSVPGDQALVELRPDRGWMAGIRQAMQPGGNQPRANNANRQGVRDGIRRNGNNSYSARSGDTTLYASKSAKDDKWTLRLGYATAQVTSADQAALLTAKYNSKALGLSEAQLKDLNALPPFGGMAASKEDVARLESLWSDYVNAADAAKPGEETKLVAALGEVGARSLEPTRAVINGQLEKIRSILTPEQIAKLQPRK